MAELMPSERPLDDDSENLSLAELFGVIRKNWWLLLFLLLLGGVSAGFYSQRQTKIYKASATIQIDPTPPKPLGRDVEQAVDVGTTVYGNTQYYQTQYRILQGRALGLQVVQRLALHRDQTFMLNLPPDAELNAEQRQLTFTEDQAQAALKGRLTVSPPRDTRLVTIHLEDADPERAKRILRALVEIYIDHNIDTALASTSVAAEWLDEQVQKLRDELGETELALHSFKRDQRILSVSLDDQSNMLRREMEQLSSALTAVRTELEALRAREEQLADVNLEDPTVLPSRELLTSSVLTTLRSRYVGAKQQLEGLLGSGKGLRHPDVVAAQANLHVNRGALISEVRNLREALQRDVNAKEAEEAGLSRLLQSAKNQALELNRLALDYHRLERAKTNTEKVYSLVLERSKESELTRHMRFNNIRLIDDAFAPRHPVRPRLHLSIALGGAIGMLLGLTLAFARHFLDRTFKTGEDVEEKLGLPLLGVLPRAAGSGSLNRARHRRRTGVSELLVHDEPTSTVAEAARALRTNLMFSSPDTPQNVLMVTSGVPFEGKTTVACWIATALAQTGKLVLLLDCDLRRPRLHRVYQRSSEIGVSSLVVEPHLLEEADLCTDVPNLHLLPAGPRVPNPAELLHSERFEALLHRLRQRYDHIVVDTPPVNAVTDAAILSTKVDGTLLVIRAHSTPYESARHSARALRDVSPNVLGVVLNAFEQKRAGYGYGSYRYHYSYATRDESAANAE